MGDVVTNLDVTRDIIQKPRRLVVHSCYAMRLHTLVRAAPMWNPYFCATPTLELTV